jgi:glycosyltransferase involved in cell wall biosynthesis
VIERDKARQALGLSSSEMVFLFFGLIRPYKGVPELIDAFNNISCSNSKLMIVGKVWTDSSQEFQELLERRLSNTNNIIFVPEFIPDDKLQLYFNACDLVVFPYQDILTSGAVILAMSFGKACIAPRMGCIAEILDDNGAFFYDRHDESGLMKAIQLAKNKHSDLLHMGEYNLKLAQNYTWEHIAEMTFKIYQQCLV